MIEVAFIKARENDIPQVREILSDGTRHKLRLGDVIWGTRDWTDEEVRDRMAVSETYVAYRGDEIVGTIALQWEDSINWGEQNTVAGYVHRLVVKEEYSGQGISQQMLDWASEQAAQHGRQFLRLDCEAENMELCNHYEKLGFIRVGTRLVPEYDDYIAALYERPIET